VGLYMSRIPTSTEGEAHSKFQEKGGFGRVDAPGEPKGEHGALFHELVLRGEARVADIQGLLLGQVHVPPWGNHAP